MDLSNVARQTKILTHRERNRTILRLRLWSGIKETGAKPWKGILVLLLCALFAFLWNIRSTFIRSLHGNNPMLIDVYSYLVAVLIPLLFLVFLVGLLLLLGTPARAKAIERKLAGIGLCSRYGHAPALISHRRVKGTNVFVTAFYSLGVGMERWEKQSAEIQDALNAYFVEPLQYGGKGGRNRNIIVVTSAPGTENTEQGEIFDDEF